MARPHRSLARRVHRSIAASAVVVLVGAGLLTTGLSGPASADIAQQIRAGQAQLDRLNTQAEAAAERYDAGQIALGKARQSSTVAQAALAHDNAAVTRLRAAAGAFAAQVYRSGVGGPDVSILSSNAGPGTLLDRLGTLDRVARTQADVMQGLATARHRQATATATARLALADAQRTLARLQADKHQVQQAAAQAQAVLKDLQVKQAQLVQAARSAAARRAAQARAADLAAQAARNASAMEAFARQPVQADPLPPLPQVTHSSGNAAQVAVQTAMDQLGKPYVWGADGPSSFDCSGLTKFAYARAGISLPHFTGAQWNSGRHVSESELQAGDLVFFGSDLGHMGMYIGNGQLVHAPHSGDVVRVASLSGWFQSNYAGAVRVAG